MHFLLVSNDLPKLKSANTVLRSDPPKSLFMEKILSQNTHYETKSFTELVTKYLDEV